MKELEFHEIANLFPLMFGEEFKEFKEDIKKNGLQEPIALYEGKILDGRNRYNACKELRIEAEFEEYKSNKPIEYILSKNLYRRQLGLWQKCEVGFILEKDWIKKAKGHLGGDRKSKDYKSSYMNSYNLIDSVDSLKETAKLLGIGRQTYSRSKFINKALEKFVREGKLKEEQAKLTRTHLNNNEKSLNEIYIELKLMEKRFITHQKWELVYVNPPWDYKNNLLEGQVMTGNDKPKMSIVQLCNLDIKDKIEKNAVLFLWVTSPKLEQAFKIIKAWGFEYKTSFVWDKVKHNWGHYNSVRHEFLLICIKGSFPKKNEKLHDSVITINANEHIGKPEYFRELIEKMYPYSNKVELFTRCDKDMKRELEARGWTLWAIQ